MRWDRLFAELEGQADDLDLLERDELIAEMADGEWAETRWHDLLGGQVVLEVRGLGRLSGEVVLSNAHLVHLAAHQADLVISASAVLGVLSAEQRRASTTVRDSLGWPHIMRALRDQPEEVRLMRDDGSSVVGSVVAVGKDFVRVQEAEGRQVSVPFGVLVAASSRR